MRCSALALAALTLLLPATVQSQGPVGPPRPGPLREEAFKMVDAYIISNLQESLGLTDEQFVKLLPLVKRLQTDRRTLMRRRMEGLRELRRVLQSGGGTEARIAELLRDVKKLETEEPGAIRKDMDSIDATLNPLQQAKFRVLELEVERKIRELMAQIRRAAPLGELGPGKPGPRSGHDNPPGPQPEPTPQPEQRP